MNSEERTIVENFHNLYYFGTKAEGHIWTRTYWMNVPCEECPLDLWMYQEIISEVRPDLIIYLYFVTFGVMFIWSLIETEGNTQKMMSRLFVAALIGIYLGTEKVRGRLN